MSEAHPAELARTAVADARVGTLSTYPRSAPHRPHVTTVHVAGQDDGSILAWLLPGSPAAQMLLVRPLATLRVAPVGYEPVTLHGEARRERGGDDGALQAFRVSVGAVRLGPTGCPVDSVDYVSAVPDAVRQQAPELLDHLNRGHAGALAACLRARGHDAETAEASGLDRRGLTAVAVGPSGVSRVRLDFPAPVRSLDELGPGPCSVLLCRCCSA